MPRMLGRGFILVNSDSERWLQCRFRNCFNWWKNFDKCVGGGIWVNENNSKIMKYTRFGDRRMNVALNSELLKM